MEITRSGSHPFGKGPADWFTGTVRIDTVCIPPIRSVLQVPSSHSNPARSMRPTSPPAKRHPKQSGGSVYTARRLSSKNLGTLSPQGRGCRDLLPQH